VVWIVGDSLGVEAKVLKVQGLLELLQKKGDRGTGWMP
jgi:hypothetical protein